VTRRSFRRNHQKFRWVITARAEEGIPHALSWPSLNERGQAMPNWPSKISNCWRAACLEVAGMPVTADSGLTPSTFRFSVPRATPSCVTEDEHYTAAWHDRRRRIWLLVAASFGPLALSLLVSRPDAAFGGPLAWVCLIGLIGGSIYAGGWKCPRCHQSPSFRKWDGRFKQECMH
jgi:hypothetical protein